MQQDIEHILIDRDTIARRVKQVSDRIVADYAALHREQRDHEPGPAITLVPILTGSFMFVADLIRHLPVYIRIQLISVSSYPGTATTSQADAMTYDLSGLPASLAEAHVLLIDDILDSGNTLRLVTNLLRDRQPASLRTCVLLRKQRPEAMATPVDYVCFDIPDEFVVGYGLDFNDYYRNLPDICTLRRDIIQRAEA